MKLTLEQAKDKLSRLENRKDPLMDSFYGGRVGFRKFKTQASLRKHENAIDKSVKEAVEYTKLLAYIKRLENPVLIERKPKEKPVKEVVLKGTYNIVYCQFANGISVSNSLKEVNGDYQKIALIKHDLQIEWKVQNLPQSVIDQVNTYVFELTNFDPNFSMTVRDIQNALNGSFWNDEQQSKIIQQAEKRQYIKRMSHTQACWTDKGLDRAKIELQVFEK